MNTRNPDAEPTLNDLLNAEDFDQTLYNDPRGTIGRVLQAQERHLESRLVQDRQQQEIAAAQEANWNKFWRANPHISRADRNEVRSHIMGLVSGGDKELSEYVGDPEGVFDVLGERADRHLKELAKQRAEDAELSAFVGGPGSEQDVDAEDLRPDPEYRLSNIIKARQSKFNRRR